MENRYKEELIKERRNKLEKVALEILKAKLTRGDHNVDLGEIIRDAKSFIDVIEKEEL